MLYFSKFCTRLAAPHRGQLEDRALRRAWGKQFQTGGAVPKIVVNEGFTRARGDGRGIVIRWTEDRVTDLIIDCSS